MPTCQNGWPVIATSRTTGPLPRLRKWVVPGTGRTLSIRDGSAGFVLIHLALWFHENIERLGDGIWDEWGWAYRPVRGSSSGFSNHAGGVAVDLNATRHPLGQRGTFTKAQTTAIRAELGRYDGAIRWGGDYVNRPDEMDFEINAPLATVRRVLAEVEDDMPSAEEVAKETIHTKLGNGGYLGWNVADTHDRLSRVENALAALAAGLGPTVEAAVKEALAEGVVDVDVTVHNQTGD